MVRIWVSFHSYIHLTGGFWPTMATPQPSTGTKIQDSFEATRPHRGSPQSYINCEGVCLHGVRPEKKTMWTSVTWEFKTVLLVKVNQCESTAKKSHIELWTWRAGGGLAWVETRPFEPEKEIRKQKVWLSNQGMRGILVDFVYQEQYLANYRSFVKLGEPQWLSWMKPILIWKNYLVDHPRNRK